MARWAAAAVAASALPLHVAAGLFASMRVVHGSDGNERLRRRRDGPRGSRRSRPRQRSNILGRCQQAWGNAHVHWRGPGAGPLGSVGWFRHGNTKREVGKVGHVEVLFGRKHRVHHEGGRGLQAWRGPDQQWGSAWARPLGRDSNLLQGSLQGQGHGPFLLYDGGSTPEVRRRGGSRVVGTRLGDLVGPEMRRGRSARLGSHSASLHLHRLSSPQVRRRRGAGLTLDLGGLHGHGEERRANGGGGSGNRCCDWAVGFAV
mmetsp:Transcript_1065/g.2315  ORF Transcript_1065/g.2315 Transcript_1065/m.2315 type:complete len:259 (+) Transcript_1065:1081-1857(+)